MKNIYSPISNRLSSGIVISLLTIALTGFSCSKSESANGDSALPAIILQEPTDGQVYASPGPIHIKGLVTDNRYIREIHIEISDASTAEQYLHVHIHPASASFNFDQVYQLKAATSYRIRVIADDAAFNSAVSSVEIRCN